MKVIPNMSTTSDTSAQISDQANAQTSSPVDTVTDTGAQGKRSGLILLGTGAALTVLGVIVALVAGADATVALRSSEMNVWMVLLPGIFGVLIGLYAYTARKAYEAAGASKSFIVVSVIIGLLFLRMAYSAFA